MRGRKRLFSNFVLNSSMPIPPEYRNELVKLRNHFLALPLKHKKIWLKRALAIDCSSPEKSNDQELLTITE